MKKLFIGREIGLIHQVALAGRGFGVTQGFWSALAHNREALAAAITAVSPFIENGEQLVSVSLREPWLPLLHDKGPCGWQIVRQEDLVLGSVDIGLVSPFDDAEGMLLGGELVHRSWNIAAALHQRYAEALYAVRAKIPVGWLDATIPFMGTIWCDNSPKGAHHVLCLVYYNNDWHLVFRALGRGGFGRGVMLPYRNPQPKTPATVVVSNAASN